MTAETIIPKTEEDLRVLLVKAMAVDPSACTAASLMMTMIGLARNQGEMTGLNRASDALSNIFPKSTRWSSPT